MKIFSKSHLCYSMNVFPEKDWFSEKSIIRKKVLALKKEILKNKSAKFAIGLWLDASGIREFRKRENLLEFKRWLDDNDLYVFTFNAFPYGVFHGKPVKKSVYLPDWTSRERLEYTCNVADLLSELLPKEITGSISTLPGAYKTGVKSERQTVKIAENFFFAAKHLDNIHKKTGRKIILGIEPEPDCLWEDPAGFISFYNKYFASIDEEIKEHIGVCYDTCHQEVIHAKPGQGLKEIIYNKIPIAKIQLSAAISSPTAQSKKTLANFADQVYLHQTRVQNSDGTNSHYQDLPDALEKADKNRLWMVHYHIPVFSGKLTGGLETAKAELRETLKILKSNPEICGNLEIETYTFSVLPPAMRKSGILQSIAKEYKWIQANLGGNC